MGAQDANRGAGEYQLPPMVANLLGLALKTALEGRYDVTETFLLQALSLAKQVTDGRATAVVLNQLAVNSEDLGWTDQAKDYLRQSSEIIGRLANQRPASQDLPFFMSGYYDQMGVSAMQDRNYEVARRSFEQSLAITSASGDKSPKSQLAIASLLYNLGTAVLHQGDLAKAREYFERNAGIYESLGLQAGAGYTMAQIGVIARKQGGPDEARNFLEEALEKLRTETSPVAEDTKATVRRMLSELG
ncbi:MAG TPA: tetratricopeptide repeat protein [Chloroflexia bacterium]|jgi:tetratricopeptide (TPR) repeat protein